LVWPLDFSTATIAEFVAEEDFPFAIFAEEALLLLKFLGHGDTVCPRFSANRWENDMLLYAAVDSKIARPTWQLSQHHSKTAAEGCSFRWINSESMMVPMN